MGLDIFLYHCQNHALNEDGTCPSCVEIEKKSKLHPKHYFEIGYYRSSYNGSGIDRVMSQVGISTLHEIFAVPDNEYEVWPDWKASLARVEQAIEKYKAHLASPIGGFSVMKEGFNEFMEENRYPHSESDALELVKEQAVRWQTEKKDTDMSWYQSGAAMYCREPMRVVGICVGFERALLTDGTRPCVYLVYKNKGNEWYLQALEIVRESIQFVLQQKDPQNYYFHWSG